MVFKIPFLIVHLEFLYGFCSDNFTFLRLSKEILSSKGTMSSLYELKLENIKERTMAGRQVYVKNGKKLGRPSNTNESKKDFLEKPEIKIFQNTLSEA